MKYVWLFLLLIICIWGIGFFGSLPVSWIGGCGLLTFILIGVVTLGTILHQLERDGLT